MPRQNSERIEGIEWVVLRDNLCCAIKSRQSAGDAFGNIGFIIHKGNRTAKPAGDLETAQEAKKIIEQQLALGLFQFPKREPPKAKELPKPTIREYWEQFKETYLKTAVQESTASGYETNFKTRILHALGHFQLDEIKPEHMEHFIADLVVNKMLARATIEKNFENSGGCYHEQ